MNSNKVHSKRTVLPFSWESKPGVSKGRDDEEHKQHIRGGRDGDEFPAIKLPPPPCAEDKSKASNSTKSSELDSTKIPPPPCPNFQHPLKSNSLRRSFRKNDDPFLIAYIECTKSTSRDDLYKRPSSTPSHGSRKGGGELFGIRKNLSIFSCKHSSNVMESSIVRVSQLPASKSQR
ncbi:OLC1v1017022C1 [Oldenlandia corymbosa var. corymbosa]|uniref:OLC1v1017022C1 n=1 Tax=Oldenlandia corymbosa var. corymbosa TaxID=529605 RepID=A0AAV1E8L1_OLDCO|nr:OLC1v1017022C1 [Oldenlandia corymbosa var. corymbosa]